MSALPQGPNPLTDGRFTTGDSLIDTAVQSVLARCAGVLPVERLSPGFVQRVSAREFVEQYRRHNRTVMPDPRTPRPAAPMDGPWQSEDLSCFGFEVGVITLDHVGASNPVLERGDTSVVRADDDAVNVGMVGLQLSRGDRAFPGTPPPGSRRAHERASAGPGDNVGLALDVLAACGDIPARVAVKRSHASAFLRTLRAASIDRSAPVSLVLIDDAPSQWARDHALAITSNRCETAALFPAKSTRADLPGEESPADRAAARALCAGIPSRSSDLLFQGGNIVVCADPSARSDGQHDAANSGRIALIGEAEIARNSDAFADPAACASAFQSELGVDRVVILPNASFHIDFDLLAATPGVVFVADELTASLTLVRESVSRFVAARLMDRRTESAVRSALGRMKFDEIVGVLWGWLSAHRTPSGAIGPAVPAALGDVRNAPSRGLDEGSASLQGLADTHRLLAAIDRLAARAEQVWIESLAELHRAYLRALAMLERARDEMRTSLSAEGWKVIAVPSAPDADRGVNALNAVSIGGRLLLPSVRGVGTAVVESTRSAMVRALASHAKGQASAGPSMRDPIWIGSDESQFRQGSVRCSLLVIGER